MRPDGSGDASRHELRTDDLRPDVVAGLEANRVRGGSRRDDLRHLQRRAPGEVSAALHPVPLGRIRARLVSRWADDRLLARRRDRADRPERQHHDGSPTRRNDSSPGLESGRDGRGEEDDSMQGRPCARGGRAARGRRRPRSCRARRSRCLQRRSTRSTLRCRAEYSLQGIPSCPTSRAAKRSGGSTAGSSGSSEARWGGPTQGAMARARSDRRRTRDRRAGGRGCGGRRRTRHRRPRRLAAVRLARAASRGRDGARPRRDRLGRPRRGAGREAARRSPSRRRGPQSRRGSSARLRSERTRPIRLDEADDLEAAFKEAFGGAGPSYVFDPLWGEPAAAGRFGCGALEPPSSISASRRARRPFIRRGALQEPLDPRPHELRGLSRRLAEHYRRLVTHVAAGDIRFDVERVPARLGRRRVASPGGRSRREARRGSLEPPGGAHAAQNVP